MVAASGEKKKIEVKSITGEDIYAILPGLARLRIIVFRDWPYLYDGTPRAMGYCMALPGLGAFVLYHLIASRHSPK